MLVFVLLAASGASALVYEVTWMRMLAGILGSTSSATAAVLAAFMGGLAAGSVILGRRADNARSALRLFAALEGAIALAAVALPHALASATALYPRIYTVSNERWPLLAASQFIFSSLFLLVPTFLMGGTLPVLVRASSGGSRLARDVAGLYAVNTAGAAIGAACAGFWLIPQLGLRSTIFLAAALNALNAIIALMIRQAERGPSTGGSGPDLRERSLSPPAGVPVVTAVLVTTTICGFAALASEVAWTRMLVFALGSTTYAFAAMLATYLSGIAAGSWAAAAAARRVRRPLRALAAIEGTTGVAIAAALFAYTRYADPMTAYLFAVGERSWARGVLLDFVATALVLMPAALLMGAAFPLACSVYATGETGTGRAIGRLYGANTLGAVAGSLAAAFVLIPLCGIERTLAVLSALYLFCAAGLAVVDAGARALRVSVTVAAGLGLALWPIATPLHRVGPTERLLFYREGRTSTVSVVQDAVGTRRLYIDKIAVAGTDPVLLTDQKSLAHVPMLLRPHATRALTVGFGSGGASWSFTRYARLRQVDCVEIDPAVLQASPFLTASHHDVMADPRFELVPEDARSYLLATNRTYDVISTDCTDLRYKSNALLYTREYFELCRRRINRGGLVAVWLPLGGLATSDLRVAMATFAGVFPQVSVWYPNNVPAHYALLLGAEDELVFDVRSVAAGLAEPTVRDDLAEIGLADLWKLFASFMTDTAGVAALTAGAPVNSDDRPILEFAVPRSGFRGSISKNLVALMNIRRPPRLARADQSDRATAERYWESAAELNGGHAAFLLGAHQTEAAIARYRAAAVLNPADAGIVPLIARVRRTEAARVSELEAQVAAGGVGAGRALNDLGLAWLSRGDVSRALDAFRTAARIDARDWEPWFNQALACERQGEIACAERAYGEAIAREPGAAAPYSNLGLLHLAHGAPDRALDELRAAEAIDANADAAYNVALAFQQLGRRAEAGAAYERAIARQPTHAPALTNLGTQQLAAHRLAEAERLFARAVAADPAYADAHYNLGLADEARGDTAAAEGAYRRAIALRPGYAEAHDNLGILLEQREERAEAMIEYRRAIAAAPAYADAHTNLALALVADGSLSEALAEARRAVELNPRQPQARVSLGLACWKRGDRAGATEAFEQALALDPSMGTVRKWLQAVRRGR